MKIEGNDITAIEVVNHLKTLPNTLNARQTDKFLTPAAEEEKGKLRGRQVYIEKIIHEFFGMFRLL